MPQEFRTRTASVVGLCPAITTACSSAMVLMFAGRGATEAPSASSNSSHTGMAIAITRPAFRVSRRSETARDVEKHWASLVAPSAIAACEGPYPVSACEVISSYCQSEATACPSSARPVAAAAKVVPSPLSASRLFADQCRNSSESGPVDPARACACRAVSANATQVPRRPWSPTAPS